MQSINLYHGSLLPKPESLPFWMVGAAFIVAVLVSGLWVSSEWQKNKQLNDQVNRQLKQQQQIEVSLVSLQQLIPSPAEETRIRLHIVDLQRKLASSQALFHLVQSLDGKRASGFSGILEDLATLPNKDFWFTHIALANHGILLEGHTYESAAIANLIFRLQQLPHTKQTQFGHLAIKRDSAKQKLAQFSLSSPSWEDAHETR